MNFRLRFERIFPLSAAVRGSHRIKDGFEVEAVMFLKTDGIEPGVMNDFESGRLFERQTQRFKVEVTKRVDDNDFYSLKHAGQNLALSVQDFQ